VWKESDAIYWAQRALVTEDTHLIWNWTPENTTECYDLAADPEERHDLWGRRSAAACQRLKRELGALVSALSVPPGAAAALARSVFAPGRRAQAPAPPVALEAALGDAVKVLGYGPVPPVVVAGAAGGEVELVHHFECARPVPAGWRPFFHLVGPGGGFQNLDHVPVRDNKGPRAGKSPIAP